MAVVFEKPHALADIPFHYCPGCTHGIVHRLVAEAFIPNLNQLPVINHIDGDKTNNKVDNLEWCTYKHNTMEAIRLGNFYFIEKRKI